MLHNTLYLFIYDSMFDGIDFHEPWIKIKHIFLLKGFRMSKQLKSLLMMSFTKSAISAFLWVGCSNG